jgi:predicted metal-binding protein
MKNVIVVGCGAYMDSGYGCPGEWRCMKAACLGEGNFDEESRIIGFVKCECPGRATPPTVGMSAKMAEMKPDEVYLSSCLVGAKPGCPYFTADELAQFIENKTGFPVKQKTHDYH